MKDVLKAVVFGGLFAVPFLTLYVENDYFFPFITGKNFWFRIIVDVTVAAWILLSLYEVKYRPRFSWIFSSFSVLLIVMFFANLFGQHPQSSFWSNFERMDGYVSLVHTFLYMIVLGSVLKTKEHWQQLLNTSLVVAFLVAVYGLYQYAGYGETGGRIDSRLGNAAYMAVYMLFHIFIAFWLFVESKSKNIKITYGLLAVMFTFVLVETGTRGTALGLAVGVFTMSGYIGLFGNMFKEFRKYAVGAFVILVLAVGGFIAARDTQFIQGNPNLARIANISSKDLIVRATIWGMAFEGVKEHPLLGWGQSNFNYVFNKYYDPSLYAQEQWFDRSHNIIFDWLIAGGILGFLAYFSIFIACLYYLFIRPILDKNDNSFTVLERGVLLGILAGYLTHNFVVFDNIVSYIFFAIILGIIHSRVSVPIKEVEKVKVDEAVIMQFAAPVVAVITIFIIYFAHMPSMAAAGDILEAMREQSPERRLEQFKEAVGRDSFAQQEVVEQLAQNAMSYLRDQKVSEETRQAYAVYAEEQLLKLAQDKPGDARIHVFIGSYYRSLEQLDKAAEQMQIAHELSPSKQSITIQQGFIELTRGDNAKALEYFKRAYELDTRNLEAREYYAGALFYAKQNDTAVALMDSDAAKTRFARSDFLLSAANGAGATEFMIELFLKRIEVTPATDKNAPQNWATLAYLYHQIGDSENAIKVLEEGKEAIPSFAPTATCLSNNIKNGKSPEEGC
ncbi:MAG: O-antigen ligase family protein [Candidatus Pacebacteria bacterium]|nr:O-antigen ligase family protein [Candidatus Paceibacterota bacterium]MBP9842553.1 O-antigen ligase family protein [Candidatus Paceibacterota bacterium]